MRKFFGSRSEDEDTESTFVLETSAITTRYQPEPAANLMPSNNYKSNGKDSAQSLFKKEREQVFAIVEKMRQAPSLETLFEVVVLEARKSLQADRVLVYRFDSSTHGVVVVENKGREWTPTLEEKLPATCFGLDEAFQYLTQQIVELDNSNTVGITPYQFQLLERFQVKASLAMPILVEQEVWGLLVVQQCSRPRHWEEMEINLLYQVVRELTLAMQSLEFRLQIRRQTDYARTATQVAAKVMDKIRRSVDVDMVFNSTTYEIRQLLKADRVGVYKFNPDWSGEFVYESVGEGWVPMVGPGVRTIWEDTHLQETKGGRYRHNETFAVDDIYKVGHSPCHVKILEEFQMMAYAIAPIFFGGDLWGLLAAYQNTGPRHWEEVDVNCLAQVGAQFGVALKQAEYLQQVMAKTAQLETVARVVDKIRKFLDVYTVFQATTQELRHVLKADRVAVYRFNPDWSGTFVYESVADGWGKLVGPDKKLVWEDSHLQATQGGLCRRNETLAVDDIYNSGLSACYIELLEQFEAKAYVVTPVFQGDQLWGLLAVYQNSGSRHWEESEVSLMAQVGAQFGVALKQAEYLQQVKAKTAQLDKAAEQERTIVRFLEKVRRSLDMDTVLRTTTPEVRRLLQADRVGVYRFDPDWSGEFVAESVAPGWTPLLTEKVSSEVSDCNGVRNLGGEQSSRVEDTYLQKTQGGRYRQNPQGFAVNDIYAAGFSGCYIETLERFEAKAYVTTPIFVGDKLWGLLGVYQNSGSRHWEESEMRLLTQVATQFGIVVQQAENLAQSQQLTEAASREKAAKEQLQQTAMQLLASVRPAFQGDLTVRAPVTEDEVGTIADAYNNTLQSLRKLVTQIKTAAANVTKTSRGSEASIVSLTNQAHYQFQELTNTREQIQEMTDITQAVIANAQQVEIAVRQANQTVQAGDAAMNLTVGGILEIRETVAETGKKIKRLSESSQKISRVVNLISNFTAQTQLLALNASIEATRAGEYGRGFAVVADEVRSLARQSATATTEIEKLVQEIQTETVEVAAAMETGIQQVVEGTNLVNETRQTLNEIVASTGQISKLVEGITQGTQAQNQQSQCLTQTMADLAGIATKTSEGAVQISTSFKELLEMAEELQASVGQFKVS